tara:strand:- start:34 stop:378 length:345 start_codon:yes stop_codon:yes gene_type:complete
MAAVYVSNLIINAGADFNETFTLESYESNSYLNLENYEVISQMRKWYGSVNVIPFITRIDFPPSSGRITIFLSAEESQDLKPGRYVYDVLLTDTYGVKTRVVEGSILVREGVTR